MSEVTVDQMRAAIADAACHELDEALGFIKHCIDQLSEEQMWWRPRSEMNSIANLMLHLSGNLRQWTRHGLGGAPDDRIRPQEFAERGPIPKQELFDKLKATVEEAKEVVAKVPPEELIRVRRIQAFEPTGIGAILHTVPHFKGHEQEIINMTRVILGENYKFAWRPTTKEQGA